MRYRSTTRLRRRFSFRKMMCNLLIVSEIIRLHSAPVPPGPLPGSIGPLIFYKVYAPQTLADVLKSRIFVTYEHFIICLMRIPSAFGFLAVLLLVSCSGHDSFFSSAPRRLAVAPAITRVTELFFDTGDRIGLTIDRADDRYADNLPLDYDGTAFTGDELLWYPGDAPATLTARYPYDAAAAPDSFRIQPDQRTGCSSSDLLVARRENVTPSSDPVQMVFRHLMCAVDVTVADADENSIDRIELLGTVTRASLDLERMTAAPASGAPAEAVVAFAAEPSLRYRAVIVPQTADLSLRVVRTDGSDAVHHFRQHQFLPGKAYAVQLSLRDEQISASLSGQIEEWTPGSDLIPDDPSQTDPSDPSLPSGPDPSDDTVRCGDVEYPVVRVENLLWMARNLRTQAPADVWTPQSSDPDAGLLYTLSAAQSLCPQGWRLPSDTDFEAWIRAAASNPSLARVPLPGVFIPSQNTYRYTDSQAYFLGSTTSDPGRVVCLRCSSDASPEIIPAYPVTNAVSVRFVRNAE